jgi:XTP/dITP diphosphohydrolase
MSIKTVLIASSNPGKMNELNQLLTPLGLEVLSPTSFPALETDVEENGLTFIENALIKARHLASQCDHPCLGDDSGLCIPALQGRPGIFSARYAGVETPYPEKMRQLLQELQDVPQTARQAYFYCALALVTHANDPTPLIAVGRWDGEISSTPIGSNGFGYDPIFYIPQLRLTSAEISAEQKNMLSHRAQALKNLVKQLAESTKQVG